VTSAKRSAELRWPALRRLVPVALLLAGAGAASLLLPNLPREHHVTLRVADPASVTGVQLAWSTLGGVETVQATSLRYTAGRAPTLVETRVSLPHGRYELEILVEREAVHEEFRRTIDLGDADAITVPLR
jgi:hypothetical protein